MRRRRPAGRMIRTMGRTAVVAGTATAVSGRVAGRQLGRQQARAGQAQAAPELAPPPQPSTAPAMGMDAKLKALDQLAALKGRGS